MKSNMDKYKIIGTFLLSGLLASCGGGNETEGGLPGGGAGGGGGNPSFNPSKTIVLTSPYSDAIENQKGEGIYKRKYSVALTDKEGNAVPDGTKVNLFVVDTIKAKGVLLAGTGSISASTLTDSMSYLGDGYTPTTFDTAYVNRRGTSYLISPADHLILVNSDTADMARLVSSVGTNSVTTTSTYAHNYPNSLYPGTDPITTPSAANPLQPEYGIIKNTYYYIGASKNGAYIQGNSGQEGVTTIQDGKATFNLFYPSSPEYILNGCVSSDPRTFPPGATDTFIIASAANDSTVTTVIKTCFAAIEGGSLTSDFSDVGSSGTVTLTLRDGGDKTPLPFQFIRWTASGNASVTVIPNVYSAYGFFTNEYGKIIVDISGSGPAGSKSTVTFSIEGLQVSVTVQIPE